MANGTPLIELEITKSQNSEGKFTMFIRVTRYEYIQSQIFVYSRNLETEIDSFSHIASVAELVDMPKQRHETGNIFYLDSSVDLEFDTAESMTDTEQLIIADVTKLRDDWTLVKDQFNASYKVIIGGS